ncbi:unnamed protein product, partial [Ascophyllum nodosum]
MSSPKGSGSGSSGGALSEQTQRSAWPPCSSAMVDGRSYLDGSGGGNPPNGSPGPSLSSSLPLGSSFQENADHSCSATWAAPLTTNTTENAT